MNAVLKTVLTAAFAREGIQQMVEAQERHQVFSQARAYADSMGKPLLVVGAPKWKFSHPYGDVTIDISPRFTDDPNVEIVDVRNIPYPDHYFGAAFASHVLEHLPTIEDAFRALDEMERVADKVFVVSPHKTSIFAWLHPDHHLWVTPSGDGYIIEQRGKGVAKEESYVIAMQVI